MKDDLNLDYCVSGTLFRKAIAQTQYALKTGALQPIPTDYQWVEDQGITFFVRILVNLVRKEKAKQSKPQDFNPFLPYEADLFVANLSPTHLCLLNKYNVIENHLLIITRQFEDQENWLTLADFEALAFCLKEIKGLGFYNGGKLAGASQKHKHLQLIPFTSEIEHLPVESLISQADLSQQITTLPLFDFPHGIVKLDNFEDGNTLLKTYHQLLEFINLSTTRTKQTGSYNLLVTRKWMMIVKRSQETFQGIPVNSLGFSGALLVKNQEQLDLLKQITPLQILKGVC